MDKQYHTGKITERNSKYFCSEDISLIENYEQAKADNFIGWCCHHRLEYLPCLQRWVSKNELIEKGIYYGRPAWELVFMRIVEHVKLHRQDPKWKEASRQNAKKATEARKKPFTIDNIRYTSTYEAAKILCVSQMTIRRWLNNPEKYNHVCRYLCGN